MNAFIIDLTHGGIKIAIEFSKNNKFNKNYKNIFAYDLYSTLKEENKNLLEIYDIKILKNLNELKDKIVKSPKEDKNGKNMIINPIHSSLDVEGIIKENKLEKSFNIINHHEAVRLILEEWKKELNNHKSTCIELTGVKGKTSTAYILKEIFQSANKDILLLSSLGSHLFKELGTTSKFKDIILEKNISITPASIINTIELAKKIANPKCSYQKANCKNFEDLKEEEIKIRNYQNNPYSNLNYDISIFESSLGVTGLGDIGILTNIVENYRIANKKRDARKAKKQIFKCPLITIEKETLDKYYPNEKSIFKNKINNFSIEDKSSNLFIDNITYSLNETEFNVRYNNLKTVNGKIIKGEFKIKTFAPGKHHVLNALAGITTALSLNINEDTIKKGLKNFKGILGRSSQKTIKNSKIIEEINPGINTKAIESSINMINNLEDYYIIIGGKYGVTCEEIDEEKLSDFLNKLINNILKKNKKINLILTDELGKSIKTKLNHEIKFIKNPEDAQNIAINENKNILFIYRSNYSQLSKR